MAETHREQAIRRMKEHHEAAKKADARGDSAETKRLMAKAFHARDVAKSIEAGKPVGSVDPKKDFSKGSAVRSAAGGGKTVPSKATSGGAARVGGGDGRMSIPSTFTRTRGGYDPDTRVDYTNTNPAYWNSVVSYFKGKPGGNPATGELGIWTPNFEKQGAESTALAAIAGGVTAHVGSNYSNNTVDDATAKRLGHASIDEHGRASTYRGGAEKAIRLNSISRGGTHIDTGRPMGGTDPVGYGAHIKGGVVTKGAMSGYLKDGGDYGGLLGVGTSITGDWLTERLGGMDSDGMRLRGTFPAVAGATGSGVGAGGTKTTVGGLYGGGVDPLASMPKVSDYTPYMDPNSIFGGLSKNAAVRSGLLYQPEKLNYGEEMAAAGMPAFSPGLLGVGGGLTGGVASPAYGSAPGGFMKPAAGAMSGAVGGGAGSKMIGSPTASYAVPSTWGGYKTSLMPSFYDLDALMAADHGTTSARGGTGPWAYTAETGYRPAALVGGHKVYTPTGLEAEWELATTFPAKT